MDLAVQTDFEWLSFILLKSFCNHTLEESIKDVMYIMFNNLDVGSLVFFFYRH